MPYDDTDPTDTEEWGEAPEEPVATRRRSEEPEALDDSEEPVAAAPAVTIKRGWGAAEKTKTADAPFAARLALTDEPQIIKFLEDEPFASYRQHWIDRQGQRSFTCISDDPKGCPLCDNGSRPSSKFAFNVLLLEDDGSVTHKSWEVGVKVLDQLKTFHTSPQQGPLSKNYWAVYKSGKQRTTQTHIQMVKGRDLDEDFGLKEVSDEQIGVWKKKAYTPDIIQVDGRKKLLEVAGEISEG